MFKIFEPYSDLLKHGFFGRENGSSVCETLGISPDDLFYSDQIHSKNVYVADRRPSSNLIEGYDSFVSNVPGLFFMIKAADCQGVLMFDPVAQVCAALHSGWRGSVKNIIGETVRVMVDKFGSNATDLLVAISPSLGPCCCQFSDPHNELPAEFERYISPDDKVDFWACSRDQLLSSGVQSENIENPRRCTLCEPESFFSYRKEGSGCGHNGVIIGLL